MRSNWMCLFSVCIAGCLTNVPDPAVGGIYACVDSDDCPGTQSCLQKVCEAISLPQIQILNPEDGVTYAHEPGATHPEILNVSGFDMVLRPLAESNEAVPGEGHLVVFVDEEPAATIDTGDLTAGVQVEIDIPGDPGVHRIRVQARLNDGTNYDNEISQARNLVWVDDGREHVALREPWPGDVFSLESQGISAVVATIPMGSIDIGAPMSGKQHTHIFYGASFPACLDDSLCTQGYSGIVPDNDDAFGPVQLPESGATMVTLTAVVMNSDHTVYDDELGEPVFSGIQIRRSNN